MRWYAADSLSKGAHLTTSIRFLSKYAVLAGLALLSSACTLPTPNSTAAVSANQNAVKPLFLSVTPGTDAKPTAVRDKQVLRFRPVKIDPALLTAPSVAPGQLIGLNLFDDVSLTAQADRIERAERGVTWVGHIQDMPQSQVTIVVNGDVVSGNISLPHKRYHIRFAGNGLHEVQLIDTSKFGND